jgi:hypothetical protein
MAPIEAKFSEEKWVPIQVDIVFQVPALYHCSSDHLVFPK